MWKDNRVFELGSGAVRCEKLPHIIKQANHVQITWTVQCKEKDFVGEKFRTPCARADFSWIKDNACFVP